MLEITQNAGNYSENSAWPGGSTATYSDDVVSGTYAIKFYDVFGEDYLTEPIKIDTDSIISGEGCNDVTKMPEPSHTVYTVSANTALNKGLQLHSDTNVGGCLWHHFVSNWGMDTIMCSMPKVHLVWIDLPQEIPFTSIKFLASSDQHGHGCKEFGHSRCDHC